MLRPSPYSLERTVKSLTPIAHPTGEQWFLVVWVFGVRDIMIPLWRQPAASPALVRRAQSCHMQGLGLFFRVLGLSHDQVQLKKPYLLYTSW